MEQGHLGIKNEPTMIEWKQSYQSDTFPSKNGYEVQTTFVNTCKMYTEYAFNKLKERWFQRPHTERK